MTRVLVTGATGFIGSALVPRLVQAGYVPRLLARRSPSPVPPPPVEVMVGDVTDGDMLRVALADVTAVVHMAAATSAGRLDPAVAYRVNVGAATALVGACRRAGARLIVLSTQHVYLPAPGLYGRTKRMADRIFRESGLPVTILRPSLVYGSGRRGVFVRLAALVRKLPVIPVIGPGRWRLRPLFLDDLVDVILDVLWPDGPPASAQSTLQSLVSRVRTELGGGDTAGGARLRLRPSTVPFTRAITTKPRKWAE